MASHIERRKLLATLGGVAAAVWPLVTRAQQAAMPAIALRKLFNRHRFRGPSA